MHRPTPRRLRQGSVDAWSIWDPYFALAELKENARVVALDKDVHKPNAFYIVGSDFVEKYPGLVAKLNAAFAAEGVWANSHHEEGRRPRPRPGVDIEAIRRFVDRSVYSVVPVDDEVTKTSRPSPIALRASASFRIRHRRRHRLEVDAVHLSRRPRPGDDHPT